MVRYQLHSVSFVMEFAIWQLYDENGFITVNCARDMDRSDEKAAQQYHSPFFEGSQDIGAGNEEITTECINSLAILQTIFSKAFSWMKIDGFFFISNSLNLFLMYHLTIIQLWFR